MKRRRTLRGPSAGSVARAAQRGIALSVGMEAEEIATFHLAFVLVTHVLREVCSLARGERQSQRDRHGVHGNGRGQRVNEGGHSM